jgi:hypothetical protein
MTILNPAFDADAREIQIAQLDSTVSLREGQAVTIAFPSAGTQTFEGRISRLVGNPAGAQIAYVAFDTKGVIVSLGDPAEVAVELARRANVLWLPPQAIQNDGRDYVVVEENGERKRIDIQVGVVSGDRVEILRGLTEGQVVLAG